MLQSVGFFYLHSSIGDSKRNERRLNVGKAAKDGRVSECRGADAGVAVTATTEWASLPFGTKNKITRYRKVAGFLF